MIASFLLVSSRQLAMCKEESYRRIVKSRAMLQFEEEGGKEEEELRIQNALWVYHSHSVSPQQCTSTLVQRIRAPINVVWSLVRRFDRPQSYKHFVRSCQVKDDGLSVGSTRELTIVSGLPATRSTERLEVLDDDKHVLSFKILGGDHRLRNYRSVTTLHEIFMDQSWGTMVIESYVVDIPEGNTSEDTVLFTDTVVRCNLQSLAQVSEAITRRR